MAPEQRCQRGHVASGFKAVEVGNAFAQSYPARTQPVVALAVTNSHPTPIVALQDNQRPRECKPRLFRPATKQIQCGFQQSPPCAFPFSSLSKPERFYVNP